jgi:hypothetical protein
VVLFGVEGTGCCGAGLTRHLRAEGWRFPEAREGAAICDEVLLAACEQWNYVPKRDREPACTAMAGCGAGRVVATRPQECGGKGEGQGCTTPAPTSTPATHTDSQTQPRPSAGLNPRYPKTSRHWLPHQHPEEEPWRARGNRTSSRSLLPSTS